MRVVMSASALVLCGLLAFGAPAVARADKIGSADSGYTEENGKPTVTGRVTEEAPSTGGGERGGGQASGRVASSGSRSGPSYPQHVLDDPGD